MHFKLATIYQRETQRGGGVIIFIRDNIKYEVVDSICIQGVIESQSVMINGTLITSLYRPPSGNKNRFIESLTEWIESQRGKQMFIAGDYNLNYLNHEKAIFDNIQNTTGLIPQIKVATRLISNTCIDNVLTNIRGKHTVSSICIADHQAIESKLWLTADKVSTKKHKYREMSEQNWNKFSQKLNGISIRGDDINEKWSFLCVDMKSAVEISFPEKQSNLKYKFTMSQGLLKSKRKKNELLRRYKRGDIPKENYVRYNKIYRKLIAKEHEDKFKEKLLAQDVTSKKKWKVLKTELKLVTKDEGITKIKVDNSEISNKSAIAEAFKNHFETCASKLAEQVPNSGDCDILIEQQAEWGFEPINHNDLVKIIDTLLPKNSCGFDLLTNRMLKKEKLKISALIIGLINETIRSGIFPEVLKRAKVIPIFKKGDQTNLNNYRPISLLPVLSKVLEKVINKQLNKKLDELHLIDDNQYGFRPGHSTEDAVIKFIDYIEKAKLNHKYVISIHIDVSKAFDSCNHDIIKQKLKRIGLNAISQNLMTSYLKDRVQEVWIEEEYGGSFTINIGVGQGTVLGPTLFKIYIMDMLLSTGLFSLRFADDSNLVGVGNNREQTEIDINRELVKLHTWFCKNKLTLHPDKSRYIVYTRDKLVNITLGGKNLMRCGYGLQEEGVKFLGVTIDENLDWKLHIKNVTKKIGKGNYLLWRYRSKLSTTMKKTIYESFVRTHITYCIPVWGAKLTLAHTNLKKMIKRIWSKIGLRRQHTNERLMHNRILKFVDEIKLAEMKIIWRWEKNKIPLGLKDIIKENTSRTLRHRKFFRDPAWQTESIASRLAVRATKEIKEIEIARSKNGLKNKIKNNCFLVEYNVQCRTRNCFICAQLTN